jgi:hypothetical protein
LRAAFQRRSALSNRGGRRLGNRLHGISIGWGYVVVRNYQRAISAGFHRERADNYRTGKKSKSDPGRAPDPP